MATEEQVAQRVPPVKDRGGKWVLLGDRQYQIPPLAFKDLRELQKDIEMLGAVRGAPTPEQMDVVVRCISAAVRRNYPDMTDDDVAGLLDVGNFVSVLEAVLAISGFGRAQPGEAQTASP